MPTQSVSFIYVINCVSKMQVMPVEWEKITVSDCSIDKQGIWFAFFYNFSNNSHAVGAH